MDRLQAEKEEVTVLRATVDDLRRVIEAHRLSETEARVAAEALKGEAEVSLYSVSRS